MEGQPIFLWRRDSGEEEGGRSHSKTAIIAREKEKPWTTTCCVSWVEFDYNQLAHNKREHMDITPRGGWPGGLMGLFAYAELIEESVEELLAHRVPG